jgi:hypothetical protein
MNANEDRSEVVEWNAYKSVFLSIEVYGSIIPVCWSRYRELVGPEIIGMDFDEIPTLGIKVYRIWPNAGIKPHTGSPARIISSLTLSTPTGLNFRKF